MTSSPLADTLERALGFHKARQLDQALAWYRAALAIAPDDAQANGLLGLALLHAGRADEGTPYLRRAIELEPDRPALRFNLVEALRQAGAYETALRELGVILAREPANPRAWERAGDVARQQQDDDGAAKAWERACQLDPEALGPALKLATLAIEQSRFDGALSVLSPLAERAAENEEIYALWCQALVGLRDWRALRETSRSWSEGHAGTAEAWRNLARAEFEQGLYREAVAAHERVLTVGEPSAGDLTDHAALCQHALDFQAAEAALARAHALQPNDAHTLVNLAQVGLSHGRFADAEEYVRRALAFDREHLGAHSILSALRSGKLDDAELDVVSGLANRQHLALDQRITATFVRAHALDARGDVDAAFAAYSQAQQLALDRDAVDRRAYDPMREERRARRLIELVPAPRSQLAPAAAPVPTPIFVVGMPRSGATLIEGVLGAHSRVLACGERGTMRQILRAYLELDAAGSVPDERVLGDWARSYVDGLPALGSADHVTDKHPLNLEAVGLIMRIFPAARVVHMRRDPVETCLSVYRHELNRRWTFAHRLTDIAHHYRCGERLAAHWARVFPGRFVTVQYEDLVRDFPRGAQALVEACGLGWEPQCLEFQRSPRAIASLSAVQVRGPVADGNGRAARYAGHLAPLIAALRASDRPTGN